MPVTLTGFAAPTLGSAKLALPAATLSTSPATRLSDRVMVALVVPS